MKKSIIVTLAVFLAGSVGNERRESKQDDPMLVICETDIGNDIDDALALDMLYKYMDRGMGERSEVMNNKDGPI